MRLENPRAFSIVFTLRRMDRPIDLDRETQRRGVEVDKQAGDPVTVTEPRSELLPAQVVPEHAFGRRGFPSLAPKFGKLRWIHPDARPAR
jgi:hypothetical protein